MLARNWDDDAISPELGSFCQKSYLMGLIACIVYRRRKHVINLFVAPAAIFTPRGAKLDSLQGYNICRWSGHGLEFFAVSDINTDELREFVEKFEQTAA